MIKRAFTLVEILVSVVLLGLISIFTSSLIYQTNDNNKIYEKKVKEISKVDTVIDTLYRDILQSTSNDIKSYNRYSILKLKSKNSLYGIEEPYISWLVLKQDNTLVRLESASKITLPLKNELLANVFMDKALTSCEHFSINLSKDKKSILSFIKLKDKKPIIFEIVNL